MDVQKQDIDVMLANNVITCIIKTRVLLPQAYM